jgi:hypothetical protein
MDNSTENGTRLRVYVAGPINGYPDGNREAFAKRALQLTELGFEPVNPWNVGAEHDQGPCVGGPAYNTESPHQYGCYLREDIKVLMYCDGITLLRGWQDSRGASAEEHVARALGLQVIHL